MKQSKAPDSIHHMAKFAPTQGAAAAATAPRKHAVSAAGVFKKPSLKVRKKAHIVTDKKASTLHRATPISALVQNLEAGNTRSHSDSVRKAGHGRKSNTHPLATSFKSASLSSLTSSRGVTDSITRL